MMGGAVNGGGVIMAGQNPAQGYIVVRSAPNVSPGVSALTGTIAYDSTSGIHWEKKNGTATAWVAMDGWRDLVAHLGSAKDTGLGAHMSWTTFSGNVKAWKFSTGASVSSGLHVAFHVDHDYKPGSLAYVHVHSAPAAIGSTGNVLWKFEYTLAKGHSQQAFPATQTISLITAASATFEMHQITETVVGLDILEPDTLIEGFLYRAGTDPIDNCVDDYFALYCDFHYQTDRSTTSQKAPPWDT